jgi:hypothetical protein
MARSLLDVFTQRDRRQRAAAIGEVYTPDIIFYEEDATVTGAGGLHERVQQLLDGAPGFVFRPVGRPVIHRGLGRQQWTFGPPGGTRVVYGTDIARIIGDRIDALVRVIEAPSPETHTDPRGPWEAAPCHSAEQTGVRS